MEFDVTFLPAHAGFFIVNDNGENLDADEPVIGWTVSSKTSTYKCGPSAGQEFLFVHAEPITPTGIASSNGGLMYPSGKVVYNDVFFESLEEANEYYAKLPQG